MGMLAKAKASKDSGPKKDAEAPQADGATDEQGPETPTQETEAGGQDDGAAAVEQPEGEEGGGDDASQDQGAGDEGGAPSEDQEGGQDGGAQGEAPGEDDGSEDSSGVPAGQPAANGHVDLTQLPVSPALKEEIQRANAALYTALYTNDKVANSVMNGIIPSGPHKIESVARMATLLVVQINKQLKFIHDAPQIVLPFTQDVVAHVLDLAQEVKKITFTDQEAQACLGTALELIMHACGVNSKQVKALQHCLPRSQIMDGLAKYHQHLAYIKGARDQGGPSPPDPTQGGPAAGAQPGAQPDQSGAQPAAQPDASAQSDDSQSAGTPDPNQPQTGGAPKTGSSPVTAAPGPGQSAPPGGMLSQAAAQPPQEG